MNERDAIGFYAFECPKCKQPPGRTCRSITYRVTDIHAARRDAWWEDAKKRAGYRG